MKENKIQKWQLQQRQKLPLSIKVALTKKKLQTFFEITKGKMYVAYSGGKDSEVLKHIVKSIYPQIKTIFVDTGTEIETRDHAIKYSDIVLKPKISMLEIWKKYGLPFPSKQQAKFIYDYKHSKSEPFKHKLLTGITVKEKKQTPYKIAEKWKKLIDCEINVSDRCCHYLKREPFIRYEKQAKEYPIIGTMATDSSQRKAVYLQHGCINTKKISCTPLGFWTEQDILNYLVINKINYCKAYGDIIKKEGLFKTTKAQRTGCVGCLFGIHLEKKPNRLQRLYKDNYKLWDIIVNKWVDGKIKKLLDLCSVSYKP